MPVSDGHIKPNTSNDKAAPDHGAAPIQPEYFSCPPVLHLLKADETPACLTAFAPLPDTVCGCIRNGNRSAPQTHRYEIPFGYSFHFLPVLKHDTFLIIPEWPLTVQNKSRLHCHKTGLSDCLLPDAASNTCLLYTSRCV